MGQMGQMLKMQQMGEMGHLVQMGQMGKMGQIGPMGHMGHMVLLTSHDSFSFGGSIVSFSGSVMIVVSATSELRGVTFGDSSASILA